MKQMQQAALKKVLKTKKWGPKEQASLYIMATAKESSMDAEIAF